MTGVVSLVSVKLFYDFVSCRKKEAWEFLQQEYFF